MDLEVHTIVRAGGRRRLRRQASLLAVCALGLLVCCATAAAVPASDLITRFAGSGQCEVSRAGPAADSPLCEPEVVAADAHGDVFIADTENYLVEKVTPDGTLSVIAGDGVKGPPTAGPSATASSLGEIQGIVAGPDGSVYLADETNDLILKVATDGSLSIVAGGGVALPSMTPIPADDVRFSGPAGLAADASGNIYIADFANEVVEKLTPGGTVTVIAGVTQQGGAPTAGPATASLLDLPIDVAVDGSGDVYIADYEDFTVEKVTPDGELSTIAGVAGEEGTPTPGPATSSLLGFVYGVAVDSTSGSVFITEDDLSHHSEVDEIAPDGTLSAVTGSGFSDAAPLYGGLASASPTNFPWGIAVGANTLYFANYSDSTIAQIGPLSDPSPAIVAPISTPVSTSVTATGDGARPTVIAATAPCTSTRTETIHWKLRAGVRLTHVAITLNGRPYRLLRGTARKATVNLAGTGPGTTIVKVTGATRARVRYSTSRSYRPCVAGTGGARPMSLYLKRA
jgi:hypothetical protein